jgi:hypothetical protein
MATKTYFLHVSGTGQGLTLERIGVILNDLAAGEVMLSTYATHTTNANEVSAPGKVVTYIVSFQMITTPPRAIRVVCTGRIR